MTEYDALIVGAGLTGATIAERCATELNWNVMIIDQRSHIGGNVYDYIDETTGIRISKYGAHIFHTNDENVWEYVNQFSEWQRWDHKVLAYVDNKYIPIPVNIETVNSLFDLSLKTEDDMLEWLKTNQVLCENPITGKDIALRNVGTVLYEKIFKHYTKKQWNKYPEELDASVLARIPIRTTNDCRYFSDKYQALPKNGYTEFVKKMVSNPKIFIKLNTSFEQLPADIKYKHLVYTGPIDSYFKNSGLPKLEYRSINFKHERFETPGFYQPCSVVNYPAIDIPYTRTVEYKHFLHQKSKWTIVVHETTTDEGDPYYPVPNKKNQEVYSEYKKLADMSESTVHFVGRLASYKYFNMDQAIRTALDFFEDTIRKGCE